MEHLAPVAAPRGRERVAPADWASPAIDHGTNAGYTTDFAGKPIPAGNAADIGAFEHQPG